MVRPADDDELDLDFIPDADEDEPDRGATVEFKQAHGASEFKSKAEALLSNAMDLLNAKILNNMAEASDIKTAVEIGKMFKIGIETVDEAAAKALAESESYESIEETADDNMRFEE